VFDDSGRYRCRACFLTVTHSVVPIFSLDIYITLYTPYIHHTAQYKGYELVL
jgi:hypothetical protein